jgi:hypothetical protein
MAPKRKKQTSQMPAYSDRAEIYCSIGYVAVLTRKGLLAMARNPGFA